ncbi:nuclear transport factor 2 family protein [Nocardia terpenica]|nr:nuclear transport factor 2 family protein [Nocardia terpenica]NQE86720.1 nuclear transport factor 2 family protein [Nocardia terpenica]
MNPRELVQHALDLLLTHDMAGFAGLWAVDGTAEFPFAPPGYPTRLAGRAAVEEYLRDYPDKFDVREVDHVTVHQTVDPEVVIVEFEAAGLVTATGAPYRLRYIAVITVRDNEIRHYRDYWNPLAASAALGGVGALTSAFGGGDA